MRIVWTIIGLLILVHGYFYVRYRTLDPCEAAILKVVAEKPDAAPEVVALLANRDIGTIGQCYWIAIVGRT